MSIESQIRDSLGMAQETLTLAYIAETGISIADIRVETKALPDEKGFSVRLERKLV